MTNPRPYRIGLGSAILCAVSWAVSIVAQPATPDPSVIETAPLILLNIVGTLVWGIGLPAALVRRAGRVTRPARLEHA